jgi:Flp pilus assembly protein TadG
MISRLLKGYKSFRDDDRGVALILVSLALPAIFGMAAFAVDLGYMVYVKNRLQTAADLGALAGGTLLYKATETAVEAKALEYVNLNLPAGWNIRPVASTECLQTLVTQGLTCDGTTKANALKVSVGATTPLFFASALGFTQANFTASAMVSGANAAPPPLNIAIVMDTTGSMNSTYNGSCGSLNRPTKIQCAIAATRGMLGTLWPSINQVAMFTYPGTTPGTVSRHYCSPKGTITVANYKAASNAAFKVMEFSTDYRGAGTPPPPGLNTNSNLVKAVGGSSGCSGMQSVGGAGTFYATSIEQAQVALTAANVALVAAGQQPRQNVMMILSDGDAGASSSNMDSAKLKNQCQQGVTIAQSATAAGTWVYSIAYEADNQLGNSCLTDTATSTSVTVTTTTKTTPRSKRCRSNSSNCTTSTGNVTTSSTSVTQSPPAPSNSTSTTTTPSPPPTCNARTNCNVSWTERTVTVSSVTNTSETPNRTACAAMRDMASDPSKFFSVAGNSGCISSSNPNTTDLVSIFKNVAVSLMKKRRIPVKVL